MDTLALAGPYAAAVWKVGKMPLDIVAFLEPLVQWVGIAALVSLGLGLIRDLIGSAVDDGVDRDGG